MPSYHAIKVLVQTLPFPVFKLCSCIVNLLYKFLIETTSGPFHTNFLDMVHGCNHQQTHPEKYYATNGKGKQLFYFILFVFLILHIFLPK